MLIHRHPWQFVPLRSSSQHGCHERSTRLPLSLGLPHAMHTPVHIPLGPTQVVVKGSGLDPAAVKAAVAKSGKATDFWQ